MNGHLTTHGRHMLVGGVGVATLMVVLGVGWQQAVTWGLLLACPVGMLAMMWVMMRGRGTGHQHGADGSGASGATDGAHAAGHASHEVPRQRVSAPTSGDPRPGA